MVISSELAIISLSEINRTQYQVEIFIRSASTNTRHRQKNHRLRVAIQGWS
ncbi:hypothetical protein VCR14J2_390211 [Vibrio coralliirubri]|nr:hypothetical protein VCR14J2_390211 [Vibrio coralliirubri]